MTHLIKLFIVVVVFLLNTQLRGQEYYCETKLLDCFLEKGFSLGVDLEYEFKIFENYLIEKGVIADNSGESYFKVYKDIEEQGDVGFNFEYSLFDSIRVHVDSEWTREFQTSCLKGINKRRLKKSTFYKLNMALDSVGLVENTNASSVAYIITNTLTTLDFNHDFYRMTALMTIAMINDMESGLTQNPLSSSQSTAIPEYSLSVRVDSLDYVFVDGEKVGSDRLKTRIKSYVDVNADSSFIHYSASRYASYAKYLRVQEIVLESIKELRTDKAMQIYNKDYLLLDELQKEMIDKKYPIRTFGSMSD